MLSTLHSLGAVDALSTSAVTSSEITSLEHESGNDSVKRRALVSKTRGSSAQLSEVLSRLWHDAVRREDSIRMHCDMSLDDINSLVVEVKGDSAHWGTVLGHIKEDFRHIGLWREEKEVNGVSQ